MERTPPLPALGRTKGTRPTVPKGRPPAPSSVEIFFFPASPVCSVGVVDLHCKAVSGPWRQLKIPLSQWPPTYRQVESNFVSNECPRGKNNI